MITAFTHADVSRISRILAALLPDGVTAVVTIKGAGYEAAVTICAKADCREFVIRRAAMTDMKLVELAEAWRTGTYVSQPTTETMKRAAETRTIETASDFTAWVRGAKRGDTVKYFQGHIARFRHEAPREILRLQDLSDKATRKKPRPSHEAIDMERMQTQLDLLNAVMTVQQAQLVELVQAKLSEPEGAIYYAVKR